MLTLSYGFKKPEVDDTGDIWMPGMESNIQQVNDHSHNGTDSAILAAKTQSISSGSWAAVSGQPGSYSQTVTLPTGFTFDNCAIQIRLSNGSVIFPTITKGSSTTYVVTVNDNTLNLTALYTS